MRTIVNIFATRQRYDCHERFVGRTNKACEKKKKETDGREKLVRVERPFGNGGDRASCDYATVRRFDPADGRAW